MAAAYREAKIDVAIILGKDQKEIFVESTCALGAAPALEGRANEELVEFLAETLGLPRRSVTLVTGEKSRDKLVEIDGIEEVSGRQRLGI